jgi:outer membrane protein assembly factor BamB
LEQESTTTFGRSASPTLVGDKLIVSVSHLVGLDANTGKVAWDQKGAIASYGTPVAAEVDKRMVIVTPAGDVLDPVDGTVLTSKLGTLDYCSPVVREGVAYFIDAAAAAIKLSFKPDGKMDKKVLWQADLDGEFFASPVLSNGRIYACNTVAQYYVIDAAKGTLLVNKAMELPPAGQSQGDEGPQVYPSLTLAGRWLLVSNTQGDTFVLEAGGEYKEVKRNELDGQTRATPVCAGKQIFLRRGANLICVGE